MYQCSKCKLFKSVDEFRKNSGIKRGVGSWCKDCCKTYEQSRRNAIKDNIYISKRKTGPTKEERKLKLKDNLRWCWACSSWVNLQLFAVYPFKNKGKVSNECNDCVNIRSINYNLLPTTKYNTYKRNAKYRNLIFNLTIEDFMYFWKKSCTYCSIEIETIGLDRIDTNIGYIKENCIPCCSSCNIMRNNQTQSEFIERVKRIAKKYG